jgi:hypothetical protein
MKFQFHLIYVLAFMLMNVSVFAQQTGVKGTVTDKMTGEPLIGVHVVVEGLPNKGTVTEIDGTYAIVLSPGKYKLTFSFVGMVSNTVEITIAEKQIITADVVLGENELTTVVVEATMSTNTAAAVTKEIKEEKGVVSGTDGTTIAKSASNQSTADVARKIPGLTVIDNRFVVVRGLSERYNAVLLNNALTPSVETDVKSFSFDLIPSQAVDRFLVYKSPSADLPGEFAGGAIRIYTRNLPDSNAIYGAYNAGFRSGTTFQDFSVNNAQSSDWTGFGLKNRLLPEGTPSNIRNIPFSQIEAFGKSLENNWAIDKMNAGIDHRFNIGFDHKFKPKNEEKKWSLGAVNQLNYSNTWQYFLSERNDYNTYDEVTNTSDTIFAYKDNIYQRQYRFAALSNWGFTNGEGTRIDFRNLFNQLSTNETTLRGGQNFEEGTDRQEYAYRYNQRSILSSQLTGRHEFTEDAKGKPLNIIDWTLGYSFAKRNEPDWRRIRYTRPIGTTDPYAAYIPFSAQPFYMGRLFIEMEENILMGAINYEHKFLFKNSKKEIHPFQPSLKAGLYLENKSREYGIRNIGYAPSNIFTFNWAMVNQPVDSILMPENINNTTGLKIDEDTKGADSYQAENKLRSYYAMAILPFTDRFNAVVGMRLEDNTQILRSNQISGDTVNVNYHIVSALPSASVTYELIKDTMQLRAAYGKTINRPEFRELAPLYFYDFIFNAINSGNPDLQTPSVDNFDFRWEWYPHAGEMISAGLFYKKFTNPIEVYFVPGGGSGGTRSFTYGNALSAVSYGIELDVSKSLGNPLDSTFISRFSIVANASFIKSEIQLSDEALQTGLNPSRPMMGQSPYIINAGIYYNGPQGLEFNIIYNRIGERIVIVGVPGIPEVYEMPRNLLDLTVTKRINKNISVRLSAQDLFNNPFRLLQDANLDGKLNVDNDQLMQYYKRGSYYTIGFSFRV